ncbi:MAG: succinylglutamate desuccinylase/aspartoacylase family protein [Deltaproteobacteria bacterium]|nr:succinylglutamate desuccinylase/aspartoacylase family protein [Deltaproteobacteria bacterium]
MKKTVTLYPEAPVVDSLDLDALAPGTRTRYKVRLVTNAVGSWTWVPVMVARGCAPGPTVVVAAAIHGNELNGIPIVQRLFAGLEEDKLNGTVVGVPVMNVPSFLDNERVFPGGRDLNRLMPGTANGDNAEMYGHRLMSRIVNVADYMIDLHTASFGRVNSFYVRADMCHPVTARMAQLQQAQIVVHNEGADGTLRAAAMERGIYAITVEVGDPMRFQRGMIRDGLSGVRNVLADLGMIHQLSPEIDDDYVLCHKSFWIHSDAGGVLVVHSDLAEEVKEGQRIATLSNIFGDELKVFHAPEDGIVVGKSTNPVSPTGARVLHLGIAGAPENVCQIPPSLAARIE